MSHILCFFYLFNCISVVTRCRYSRGWTNGRKRADPTLIQLPQPMMMRGSHPTLPVEYTGTAPEDWSRNRVNEEVNHFQMTRMNLLIFSSDEQQVNEEGDVYDNRYTKLASFIDSVMKTNAKNEIGQP